MIRRRLSALLMALCAACAVGSITGTSLSGAAAQGAGRSQQAAEPSTIERVNEGTIGLAGGLLEGTFIRFAAEIAKVVDDPPNLRVLPVVSYGAVGNVSDLLYLKGIDVAITQADVLDYFKREGNVPNIGDRIHYIARFFVAEVHVYVRSEIKTFEDLAGKKVSFNTVGSAANLTGGIVFDRLGVAVERVYMNNAAALEKMRNGDIAGIVHVVGKPNELLSKFKPEPGFHFLTLEYSDKFKDYYVPADITSDDYPNLIAKGEHVDTIGVPTVLAVYNWPKSSDRYARVARFIEQFCLKFDQFKQPPFQPKWQEINLAATVPGWKRYSVAEDVIGRINTAQPVPPVSSRAEVIPDLEEKFNNFLAKWKRNNGKSRISETDRANLFQEYRALIEKEQKNGR